MNERRLVGSSTYVPAAGLRLRLRPRLLSWPWSWPLVACGWLGAFGLLGMRCVRRPRSLFLSLSLSLLMAAVRGFVKGEIAEEEEEEADCLDDEEDMDMEGCKEDDDGDDGGSEGERSDVVTAATNGAKEYECEDAGRLLLLRPPVTRRESLRPRSTMLFLEEAKVSENEGEGGTEGGQPSGHMASGSIGVAGTLLPPFSDPLDVSSMISGLPKRSTGSLGLYAAYADTGRDDDDDDGDRRAATSASQSGIPPIPAPPVLALWRYAGLSGW